MFILRRITSEGIECNTCMGIEYVLVIKERNEKEFELRTELWDKEDLKDVYGIVCFNGGENLMPLYSKSSYYIMSSDGRTFEKVTQR